MFLTDHVSKRLQQACTLAALAYIATFFFIALSSITYPYTLEWMEGQTIDVIERVREGQGIYVAPSLDHVAFVHTPLYYYVSALVSLIFGVEFFAARLVSLLATLCTGYILYRWVRKEGGRRMAALVAGGLYFATYEISGRWFDVARIDSLYVCFLIWGMYVFYFHRSWRGSALASLILAAAVFTRQSALLAAAPALIAFLLIDRVHAIRTLCIFAFFIICPVMIANMMSHGWFLYYTYDVMAGHPFDVKSYTAFWTVDVPGNAAALVLLAFIMLHAARNDERRIFLWYMIMTFGVMASTYLTRLYWGSYLNAMMPMYAMLALLAGVALAYAARMEIRTRRMVMWVLVLLQFASLRYDPVKYIPTEKDVQTGDAFIAELAKYEGELLAPELQWVVRRAGKRSYALGMAAHDVLRSNIERREPRNALEQEIRNAVASGRFAAVIPGRFITLKPLDEHYVFSKRLQYPREFVTGALNLTKGDVYVLLKPKPKASRVIFRTE